MKCDKYVPKCQKGAQMMRNEADIKFSHFCKAKFNLKRLCQHTSIFWRTPPGTQLLHRNPSKRTNQNNGKLKTVKLVKRHALGSNKTNNNSIRLSGPFTTMKYTVICELNLHLWQIHDEDVLKNFPPFLFHYVKPGSDSFIRVRPIKRMVRRYRIKKTLAKTPMVISVYSTEPPRQLTHAVYLN